MKILKKAKSLIALSGVLLLTSCGNLKKVQKIGEFSEDLTKGLNLVGKDIYESCLRKSKYPISGLFPSVISDRKIGDERCEEKFKPVSENVKNTNSILVSYVSKLSELANYSPGYFRTNIDSLRGSLDKLNTTLSGAGVKTLDSNVISSGFNLVNLLTEPFTYGFRKRNVATTIVCTNPDIQTFTSGLQNIAQDGYLPLLKSEKQVIESYYRNLTPAQGEVKNISDLESSHNLTKEYNEALGEVIKKENAAEEYIAVLQSTASAHEELSNEFTGKQTMNSPNLKKKCNKFFAEGKRLIKKGKSQSLQTNTALISESNINTKNVEKIIYKYYLNISPRIKKIKESF